MNVDFVITTPTLGAIRNETRRSVDKLRYHLHSLIPWIDVQGMPYVDRAKSRCLTRFLEETEYPYVLMLDDDMEFEPEEAIKVLDAVREGREYVGGFYLMNEGGSTAKEVIEDCGDLLECWGIGGGFSATSRKFLKQMIERVPLPFLDFGTSHKLLYPFYESGLHKNDNSWQWIGEDYDFCNKVRQAGGKCYVHTEVQLGHIKVARLKPKFDKKKLIKKIGQRGPRGQPISKQVEKFLITE